MVELSKLASFLHDLIDSWGGQQASRLHAELDKILADLTPAPGPGAPAGAPAKPLFTPA
jgi:hypothetical protein